MITTGSSRISFRWYQVEYTRDNQRYRAKIFQKNEEEAVRIFQQQYQKDYDWITPYDTKD